MTHLPPAGPFAVFLSSFGTTVGAFPTLAEATAAARASGFRAQVFAGESDDSELVATFCPVNGVRMVPAPVPYLNARREQDPATTYPWKGGW